MGAQQVGCPRPPLFRYHVAELAFDLVGVFPLRKAKARGNSLDVRVHSDGLSAEGVGEHHVCGLSPDARQRGQLLQRIGHFAVMFAHESFTAFLHGLCLPLEETGGADQLDYRFPCGLGNILRGRKSLEEGGCHHVDALISALRGEYGGDQKLQGRVVVQIRPGVAVDCLKNVQYSSSFCALTGQHLCLFLTRNRQPVSSPQEP